MINYSLSLIGKNLEDLTYQDITTFFVNEQIESNIIEFKSYSAGHGNFNSSIKGIIRTICALLNSEGGLVILGAPGGVVDPVTNEKKFVGPLSPVTEYKEKDWVINKISDVITPLPIGIKVKILQQTPTDNLYIFEVQQSPYSPHQYENIYLVRLDGQTKPAPHYLIDALFRKIRYPNIEGYLRFDTAGLVQSPSLYYVNFTVALFNFSSIQNEENVVYRLLVAPGKIKSQLETKEPATYSNTEPLLHFGTPMLNNQTILLTPAEVNKNGFKLHIVLTIGGKKSPVKSSTYTLDLKNINLSNNKDTSRLISEAEENLLMSDRQERLGSTRESVLRTILGRNIF